MSAPLALPSPIFTLSIYEEGDQVKSVHCFRDPACDRHREAVLMLLRRALSALDCPTPPAARFPHKRQGFPKA